MSVEAVASPNSLTEEVSSSNNARISHSSNDDIHLSRARKRSYEEVIEDDFVHFLEEDDVDDDDTSDMEDFMIVKESTKNKRRKVSTSVPHKSDSAGSRKVETLTVDSDDSDDEAEDSEKEEIEILSETKLEKAELLRREQNFKKLTCPVCLDTPDPIIATPCGHLFCCECIIRALASSKTKSVHSGICPVCRKNVRYKDLQLLAVKHLS